MFPTRSDTNQAVQLHKMVRGLKFWIEEVGGLTYLHVCSCAGTAQLICTFVLACAKSRLSHIKLCVQLSHSSACALFVECMNMSQAVRKCVICLSLMPIIKAQKSICPSAEKQVFS